MRRSVWIAVFTVAFLVPNRARSDEHCCCPPPQEGFLKRFAPVGGWRPYGLGLFHWWPCRCFPCNNGRDDYCRKPLPHVCWPPYPPYYIYGPSANCFAPCCACERR
jgi:hypothetical protein